MKVPNQPSPTRSRSKKKPRKPWKGQIPEALDTPAFRALWLEWLQYREGDLGRFVTQRAGDMQLRLLAPHGSDIACRTIQRSIASDWQGLFPEHEAREAILARRSGQAQPRALDVTQDQIQAERERQEAWRREHVRHQAEAVTYKEWLQSQGEIQA